MGTNNDNNNNNNEAVLATRKRDGGNAIPQVVTSPNICICNTGLKGFQYRIEGIYWIEGIIGYNYRNIGLKGLHFPSGGMQSLKQ